MATFFSSIKISCSLLIQTNVIQMIDNSLQNIANYFHFKSIIKHQKLVNRINMYSATMFPYLSFSSTPF